MAATTWMILLPAVGCCGLGFWLGRRYGRAIRHTGIGRAYPLRQSALAFLGDGLLILGLVGILIGAMIGFF